MSGNASEATAEQAAGRDWQPRPAPMDGDDFPDLPAVGLPPARGSWFKAVRSPEAAEVMRAYPFAFLLASVIGSRARRVPPHPFQQHPAG